MKVLGVLINSIIITLIIFLISCRNESPKKEIKEIKNSTNIATQKLARPNFDRDSAYAFVKKQVDFGPRFPNNKAHEKCAIYLKDKLASFGIQTSIQLGKATTFDGNHIIIKNIIGEYNPKAIKRILLFAHWDSRPFADQDTKDRTKPILGANDGASGVGILLEVARQLSIKKPNIGVDIIFFDAEDYGEPSSMSENNQDSWCLGTQYWAKNPHKAHYHAEFGILLDMTGNANPFFTQESISMNYAPQIVRKVWDVAQKLGYDNIFVNKQTYFVGDDDHRYINEINHIPSIDIIHYDENRNGFHPSWHTHKDNMDVIDKNTLGIVGETLLATIMSEQ